MPRVFSILTLLVLVILFYAWFGVVIFYDSPQGKRDFANLIEGCWTLWQMVTTVNYPDVMMPSYNDNRLAGLYFVSFMILCFFFFMNLILATIFNAYEEEIDQEQSISLLSDNEIEDSRWASFEFDQQTVRNRQTGIMGREWAIKGLHEAYVEALAAI